MSKQSDFKRFFLLNLLWFFGSSLGELGVYKSYLESKAGKSRLIGYYIRYKQAANWHWRVARDDKSCEILMKWRFGRETEVYLPLTPSMIICMNQDPYLLNNNNRFCLNQFFCRSNKKLGFNSRCNLWMCMCCIMNVCRTFFCQHTPFLNSTFLGDLATLLSNRLKGKNSM